MSMKSLCHISRCVYGLLGLLLLIAVCVSCGDGEKKEPLPPVSQMSPSFSFFDVGVNTPFSRSLRKQLQEILGDDAISSRNTLDLAINTDGFLADHFAGLARLNTALNQPHGERVEHNTIKLAYRYAVKKGLPFDYVEILFSEKTRMPLLIQVEFEADELSVRDSLEEKYGVPRVIPWKQKHGKSLYWEKSGDRLFYSFVPNQFGVPEYRVTIYFTHRLKNLVEMEQDIKSVDGNASRESGTSAF